MSRARDLANLLDAGGDIKLDALDNVATNPYEVVTVSTNRTLDENGEYSAGAGTTVNDGVTLTVPDSTLLDIKIYQVGKAL